MGWRKYLIDEKFNKGQIGNGNNFGIYRDFGGSGDIYRS
jgi:hypothetical protein